MGSWFRQLMSNLGAVVTALLLAFVIWFAATLQADPFDTAQISNVTINILSQPQDTVFYTPIT